MWEAMEAKVMGVHEKVEKLQEALLQGLSQIENLAVDSEKIKGAVANVQGMVIKLRDLVSARSDTGAEAKAVCLACQPPAADATAPDAAVAEAQAGSRGGADGAQAGVFANADGAGNSGQDPIDRLVAELPNQPYHCGLCDLRGLDLGALLIHELSHQHQSMLESELVRITGADASGTAIPGARQRPLTPNEQRPHMCAVCAEPFQDYLQWAKHSASVRHIEQVVKVLRKKTGNMFAEKIAEAGSDLARTEAVISTLEAVDTSSGKLSIGHKPQRTASTAALCSGRLNGISETPPALGTPNGAEASGAVSMQQTGANAVLSVPSLAGVPTDAPVAGSGVPPMASVGAPGVHPPVAQTLNLPVAADVQQYIANVTGQNPAQQLPAVKVELLSSRTSSDEGSQGLCPDDGLFGPKKVFAAQTHWHSVLWLLGI
eukprot:evm.model.scf_1142EXC.2 EVM.evm.TU.scf_1142EXC.2   scf_1142EXC:6245-11243(-)